jgi:hypothetical protein
MSTAHDPNALINSLSPYLLQHAYNPVKWMPWGEEAFAEAKAANKLMIISIGYSACHWCHVMEHESFEDEEVAVVMNKNYVCVKVDREERPDIDKIYMDAVQLMTGRGGWPLNCIVLPDGRPIYGGTYFPKEQWRNVLLQIAAFYRNDSAKCSEYADELTQGIQRIEMLKPNTAADIPSPDWNDVFLRWSANFDEQEGGPNRSPKFPMPSSYDFLLQYFYFSKHPYAGEHVQLTLKKMAYGGIYDQIGGGFTRYSTDMLWKVPHFEKMLYDNGQLLSLYAKAYMQFKDPLYKEVVYDIFSFVQRELTSPRKGFFSALDADSEGVEGKFYTWTKNELTAILSENDKALISDYFNINDRGYWEHDVYIPLRHDDDNIVAERFNLTAEALKAKIESLKKVLLAEREKRVRPGLDYKIITGWNALMITGLADAYLAFKDTVFLEAAYQNVKFIREQLSNSNGELFHSCVDDEKIIEQQKGYAFLDDYSLMIEAYIKLYQCDFNEAHLQEAKRLTEKVKELFEDQTTKLFYFTPANGETLIARKMELQDNVIASSNAVMAGNLFYLSRYFGLPEYEELARTMAIGLQKEIVSATPWYSKWAQLLINFTHPFYEIVVSGDEAPIWVDEIRKNYRPDLMLAIAKKGSQLSICEGRFSEEKTVAFVCKDKVCSLPIESPAQMLQILNI